MLYFETILIFPSAHWLIVKDLQHILYFGKKIDSQESEYWSDLYRSN